MAPLCRAFEPRCDRSVVSLAGNADPRQAPDGDQVDLVEFMEIVGGLIAYHRVYWGWKGCGLIAPVLSRR